ncbi:MAG: tetratricopeptide repeat protein [Bacteroidetes bacterium]|nr:tetratricopeptide repeat protein [Bacteroidota bacterium]
MKKLSILSLITLFFVQIGFAQTEEFVMTWSIVVSEVKKADASVENPKKATNPTTWMEVGRKYLQLYTFDLKNLQPGLTSSDVMFILGSPKTKTEDTVTVFNYDRLTLYFKNDRLVRYERAGGAKEFFPEHSTALDKAAAAYLKAKELDAAGKQSKKIGDQLKNIAYDYTTEGDYFYRAQDYVKASQYFSKAADIAKTNFSSLTVEERLAMLNNAGTIARFAKEYEKSAEFFKKALELSPKLSLYGDIYASQVASGDTASAINTLKNALNAFPNDTLAVVYTAELINLYIQSNQIDQALTYLDKALEKDPKNVMYLFNKGVLYNEQGKTKEAEAAYLKALEINPNDEGSNLNLGKMFVEAAKVKGEAADAAWLAKNKQKFTELENEQKALLKQAIPYLKKYAEVVTEPYYKINAYKDLRNIYNRLEMTKEAEEAQRKMDALK